MDYDYLENVTEDVKMWIEDNDWGLELEELEFNRDEVEEELYEKLWVADSVTGNESGYYVVSDYEAEEFLCHNMDFLDNACYEFGIDLGEAVKKGPLYCDLTIRCYLLAEALSDVLDEITKELRDKEDTN